MGRLKLDILCLVLALIVVNCVVQCQYYVERPQPLYIVEGDSGSLQEDEASEEYDAGPHDQFMSRSGAPEEDSDEDDDSDESVGRRGTVRPNGRAPTLKLPADFNSNVRKQMRVPPRPRKPLHGDPSPIQDDDDEGRRPESRLLWPFSIEITKGDKGPGWGGGGEGGGGGGPSHHGSGPHHHGHHGHHGQGHGHGGPALRIHHVGKGHGGHHKRIDFRAGHGHGSHDGWGWDAYTSWASQSGWGGGGGGPSPGGWGSYSSHPYNYGWEEEKGLTDEEILKSKHYKKYQKKKKKKIKKLKKKLKFKRLIQKILQKHITYLDKIAPY